MSFRLHILHLEDDVADAALVRDTLEMEGIACDVTRVETESAFLTSLQQGGFDLILADYTLPSFDGLSALRIARQQRPDLPFIFVSGTLGEEVAIEALKIGATDYVLKTGLSRLAPAVHRGMREAGERAERKKAEEALRRSERELRKVIETIPAMVWSALPDGSNVLMNSRWTEYTGLSATGLGWQSAVHPDDLKRHMNVFFASSAAGLPLEDEVRFRRSDGEYRWFLVQGMPLRDEQGNVVNWYGIVADIEDRKRAEEARLEERVRERTRIARELHDTLLQSAHGVLLRFQTVSQLLPDRPAEAKETLDNAIDETANFITEARDAVQGLRDSTVQSNDLALAISTLGQELRTDSANHQPAFRVAVEGEVRNLHPIVRDEIYKIAAEALRNGFRHSQARGIEVEIRYDNEQFRLRVRDDGKGIDPAILSRQGGQGHYGLPGMRERATLIGGKLVVLSEADAGTEVELSVPASTAYATAQRSSWFSRKAKA
jgi:PAS domain S-box-containing protein